MLNSQVVQYINVQLSKWAASSVPATKTNSANTLFHLPRHAGFKCVHNVVLLSAVADVYSGIFTRQAEFLLQVKSSQVAVDRCQVKA